jgi:nitrate reductase beta subunit
VTQDAYELRGECGFSFGDGCMPSDKKANLFGGIKVKNDKPRMGAY